MGFNHHRGTACYIVRFYNRGERKLQIEDIGMSLAPSFLKRIEFLKSSIDNIHLLGARENFPIQFFCPKNVQKKQPRNYSPSNSTIEKTFRSPSFLRPFKSGNSNTNQHSIISPPSFSTRFAAAEIVPPVAIKSSMMTTLSPFLIASSCISMTSSPYSKV